MPKHAMCINRTLILSACVEVEAPDEETAGEIIRSIVETEEGCHTFGVIHWRVEPAIHPTTEGYEWHQETDFIRVEHVMQIEL